MERVVWFGPHDQGHGVQLHECRVGKDLIRLYQDAKQDWAVKSTATSCFGCQSGETKFTAYSLPAAKAEALRIIQKFVLDQANEWSD